MLWELVCVLNAHGVGVPGNFPIRSMGARNSKYLGKCARTLP